MKLFFALVLFVGGSALASVDGGVGVPDVATDRAAALMDALRKQHKGTGPCYRWDRRSTVTDESVSTTAVMLKDRRITSDEFMAVVPLFMKWTDESEKKAHALSERDELRKTVRDLAPPEEREKMDKNPQALDELANKIVSKPVDSAKAQAAFDKLSKAKQAAIKDVYKAHPAALRLSFIDVAVALKKLEKPAELSGDQHDDHGHAH